MREIKRIKKEIDVLVNLAQPVYDPWDNMQLLRHYLESIVYGGDNWSGIKPKQTWACLFEIKQQLEEGRFNFDELKTVDNNTIPVWLIVHKWVEVDPSPTVRYMRKRICLDVLKEQLCSKPVQSLNDCDYPIDPKTNVPYPEYLGLWRCFKQQLCKGGGNEPQPAQTKNSD